MQAERVAHYVHRMEIKGLTGKDVVIVLINVDSRHGALLAEALMPGHDWQVYRDQGQIPFARGLADRSGIEDALEALFGSEVADALRTEGDAPSVVVLDHDVAAVIAMPYGVPTDPAGFS
jgi:hypothetical protein